VSTDDPTEPREGTVARLLDDPAVWAEVPPGLRERVIDAATASVAAARQTTVRTAAERPRGGPTGPPGATCATCPATPPGPPVPRGVGGAGP
jgi:hypothetical protein